jgi:hypothetical protein
MVLAGTQELLGGALDRDALLLRRLRPDLVLHA